MKDLWMKALRDLELEVLPDGGRRLWWLLVPVNWHISTWVIISSATSMSCSSTSNKCKECSPEQLSKEHMKSNLKTLRHTRKRPLHADKRRQLGGEPPVHSRSVVKIFYNRDIVSRWLLSRSDLMMIEEVPHGYVPVFPTMIYFIDQSYMKPSEKISVLENQSTFEIKNYILHDEFQKGKSGSPIYITP